MKKPLKISILLLSSFFLLFWIVKSSFYSESALQQSQKVSKSEADQIIKKTALSLITPHLEKSLKQSIELSNNTPDDFAGFPSTCFAPDTDQAVIDEFYRNRTAIKNSLGISGIEEDSRFNLGNRWSSTATNGFGLGQGDITTLTWSYVADGTAFGNGCGVTGESGNSNFIAFFNGIYGGPTTPGDFTTAPWHSVFVDMFNSWSNVSGLIFVYEPNDDGVPVVTGGAGVLGVRGDMRISGRSLDGNSNVLACNYFPGNGDMIIDTSDNFYVNSPGNGTTNVLTHEIGHGLGIAHVCPINTTKLMEPFVTTAFLGPQEDDILATNRHYGDPEGVNDTPATASFLGISNASISYSKTQRSIDDNNDVDYYSFTTGSNTVFSGTLTPTGTTYLSGTQNADGSCSSGSSFNALTISDLMFEVVDTDGVTVLATGNANGVGIAESLNNISLPASGTFYVRVQQQGAAIDNVQMYDLNFSLVAPSPFDNDVAVTAIIEPTEFETGLTSTEQLQITITNFGALSQASIPYEIEVNGVVVVLETYNQPLASGNSVTINVPTSVDLSAFGFLDICVRTTLSSDENMANDESCKSVLHVNCIPSTTTGCNVDGIKQFVLGTINVDDGAAGCNTDSGGTTPNGYSNRTNLITDLDRRSGFNIHTLQASTRFNNERIKVWVDLNDNGLFTDAGEELLNQTFTITNGTLENFSITIPSDVSLGNKMLRARAFDAAENSSTTGPCDDITYGETQDYIVNIVDPSTTCEGGIITWNGTGWSGGIAPGTTDIAIIDGPYSTATDGTIDVCELTINENITLTVDGNTYIRVQNDITVSSNATLDILHTGSVVQVEDAASVTNNGAINVAMTTPVLKPRDFMIIGSPMTGVTREGDFTAANKVMNHDTTLFVPNAAVAAAFPLAENFVDDNFNDYINHSGVLNAGEGYLLRPRPVSATGNEAANYTFTQGTLNNGIVNQTIIFQTDQNSSFNLIANPYASAINAIDFINANAMIDAVYFWEHVQTPSVMFPGSQPENFSMEDVSMFNLVGGVAASSDPTTTPNGFISTGQGFGIKASAAGTAVFNNAMREVDNNNTLRTANEENNKIWLTVTNNDYNLTSSTLIGFIEGATSGLDAGYDSKRMATSVSVYSHLEDGSMELGIQGREAFDISQSVSLGFSSQVDEESIYTIAIQNMEGIALLEAEVYIIDHAMNITHKISESDYSFASNAGNQSGRFTLVFEERDTLGNEELQLESIAVYPNPTSGILNITSPNTVINSVEIVDMRGRIVLQNVIDATTITMDVSTLGAAVYFVKVNTDAGSVIKRLLKK